MKDCLWLTILNVKQHLISPQNHRIWNKNNNNETFISVCFSVLARWAWLINLWLWEVEEDDWNLDTLLVANLFDSLINSWHILSNFLLNFWVPNRNSKWSLLLLLLFIQGIMSFQLTWYAFRVTNRLSSEIKITCFSLQVW